MWALCVRVRDRKVIRDRCPFLPSRDLAVREIPSVIDTIFNFPEFEKLCLIADKLARDTGNYCVCTVVIY